MATGGTEKFCFHFLQRRDFENAKYPGGKISPLIYYYNRQGAKWPGARTGNKKSSKLFQTYCFRWSPWRLVFSFESLGLAGMTITRLANKNFSSQIKKNTFIVLYKILYICASFLNNCVAFRFQLFLLCLYTAGIFCVQFPVCL